VLIISSNFTLPPAAPIVWSTTGLGILSSTAMGTCMWLTLPAAVPHRVVHHRAPALHSGRHDLGGQREGPAGHSSHRVLRPPGHWRLLVRVGSWIEGDMQA
jgi:hypothetical protein